MLNKSLVKVNLGQKTGLQIINLKGATMRIPKISVPVSLPVQVDSVYRGIKRLMGKYDHLADGGLLEVIKQKDAAIHDQKTDKVKLRFELSTLQKKVDKLEEEKQELNEQLTIMHDLLKDATDQLCKEGIQ